MTKEEADELIVGTDKVGTFLIRFSSTYADSGSFVVCLKTDSGSEHVLLEVTFEEYFLVTLEKNIQDI